MNKKAQILVIVLALAVAVVVLSIAYGVGTSVKGQTDIEKCRESVLGAAKAADYNLKKGEQNIFSVNCPIIKKEIKLSDVSLNGKINKKKVNELIAGEMYDCYSKTGMFKLDPFGEWDNKDEAYCIICSEITFDDKFAKQYDYEIRTAIDKKEAANTGFYTYLLETNLHGKDQTFFNAIFRSDADSTTIQNAELADKDSYYLTDKTNYVVFSMRKQEEKNMEGPGLWIGLTIIGVVASIVTGGAAIPIVIAIGAGAGAAITTYDAYRGDCPDCIGIGTIFFSDYDFLYKRTVDPSLLIDKDEPNRICTVIEN